jgi:hypothetical protein
MGRERSERGRCPDKTGAPDGAGAATRQISPSASMARATRWKPAMLAPTT